MEQVFLLNASESKGSFHLFKLQSTSQLGLKEPKKHSQIFFLRHSKQSFPIIMNLLASDHLSSQHRSQWTYITSLVSPVALNGCSYLWPKEGWNYHGGFPISILKAWKYSKLISCTLRVKAQFDSLPASLLPCLFIYLEHLHTHQTTNQGHWFNLFAKFSPFSIHQHLSLSGLSKNLSYSPIPLIHVG